MATLENYNDIFIYLKVIEQLNVLKRLKISPFTNLPCIKWGYLWSIFIKKLVLIFWKWILIVMIKVWDGL
jgi:hypothetical protein